MIEMHIRPTETLRCESRRPARELGILRWSLAATIVLAAGLDALWLVPARESRRRVEAVSAQPSETMYPAMQHRRCRKLALRRQLAAAQARVHALEAEVEALELEEIESNSIEVTLVEASR